MEKTELIKALAQLDNNTSRNVKVLILKFLEKNYPSNARMVSVRLSKAHSHIQKHLNFLNDRGFIDYNAEYHNEGLSNGGIREYSRKVYQLTDLGFALIAELNNPNSNTVPNLFFQHLIKKVRISKSYKDWVEQVNNNNLNQCILCGKKGNLQVHHKKHLAKILKESNVKSISEALSIKELFDPGNGQIICGTCHIEKHALEEQNG